MEPKTITEISFSDFIEKVKKYPRCGEFHIYIHKYIYDVDKNTLGYKIIVRDPDVFTYLGVNDKEVKEDNSTDFMTFYTDINGVINFIPHDYNAITHANQEEVIYTAGFIGNKIINIAHFIGNHVISFDKLILNSEGKVIGSSSR